VSVSLRPIESSDVPFLFDLYASTRADELATVDWSAEEKQAFLAQQFIAQQRAYTGTYDGADFQVILCDGVRAGRLYLARWPAEIRIVDIALLPEYRGRGIGSALIRDLQSEAVAGHSAISIHVERFNPAKRLYERLGFALAAERDDVYLLMRWDAGGATGLPSPDQPKTAS
jgi:ribosomal protein S18 acetylase RimI-like enzyme